MINFLFSNCILSITISVPLMYPLRINNFIHRTSLCIYRNPSDLSISKRAPSGFMGMRGKKDDEYSDYVGQDPNFEERGRFNFGKIFGIFGKKPRKFPGMVRVKPNKRFPLGFTGEFCLLE